MFHCMPVGLANQSKEDHDEASFVIKSSFLVIFVLIFVTTHVGYKMPSPRKMYKLLKE